MGLAIAALVLMGLGLAAAFALGWLSPEGPGPAIALGAASVLGLALAALALVRAGGLRAQAETVSGEIDGMSERLLALEARLDALAAREGAEPGLGATVAEVSGEIGVLGGLLRDLAVAVSAQDRDLAALKAARGKPSPAPREVQPHAPRPAAQAAPASAPQAAPAARKVIISPLGAEKPPAAAARAPGEITVRKPLLVGGQLEAIAAPPVPAVVASRSPSASEEREQRQEAAILAAFEADRIELHLQPVVSLPQRKVQFYEALARLRLSDQSMLVPAEFLPVLERAGRLPNLDRTMLARSAAIARHLAMRGSEALIACNLASASIAEPGFLRAVGRLLDAHPDLPGRMILEVSQRCWRTLDAEQAGALAHLRDRGLAFALDRAADLRLDPLSLADRGVRYVKLAAEALLRADASRGLDLAIGDLAAVLARAGIRLIAEGVEREEDVPALIDLDVPLAQGFVFAPPRAVRAEVLSPPAASPGEARPAPAPAAEAAPPAAPAPVDERRPFRTFLRRAG